ncbi:MAG: hypothetical protein AB7O24_11285 [Kofleriaceae bacterium]
MATRNPTPEISKLQRARPLAYSRRQKSEADSEGDKEADPAAVVVGDEPPEEMVDAASALSAFAQAFAAKRGEVSRTRAETIAMPLKAEIGEPPAVPAAPHAVAAAGSEDRAQLALLPGPREIPTGDPNDPAEPPGQVPPGDSRSLRRDGQFALVYRIQTFVISRFGNVGTRGQWRVVEYPTSAAAAHAYAQETSRFVGEGFSDYRD